MLYLVLLVIERVLPVGPVERGEQANSPVPHEALRYPRQLHRAEPRDRASGEDEYGEDRAGQKDQRAFVPKA
jgi:hypothetical protein